MAATNDDDEIDQQLQMLQAARENIRLASVCMQEVSALIARVKPKLLPLQSTGLPTFVNNLQRERETLEAFVREVGPEDPSDSKARNRIHALEARVNVVSRSVSQWDRLKRCRGLVAVNQNFQGSSRSMRREEMDRRNTPSHDKQVAHRILKDKGRVEVDVVDSGREWLVAKAVQRNRLAREMGDCGWAWGDHEPGEAVDPDEWNEVPLAKFVQRLIAAARLNRYEYHFPRIRLVLSNLARGDRDLDIFIDQLGTLDPLVQVTIEYQNDAFMATPPPTLEIALDNLAGSEHDHLTPTLNLDHTILIDMISDLTHARLQPQPWQAPTTRAQIEEENKNPGGIMAAKLYPLLAGRKLVCTNEAAEHFHNVIQAVGTETERERGRLMIPWDDHTRAMSTEAIRARFQQLSIHALPPDVQLPLEIAPGRWDLTSIPQVVARGDLPRVALDVARFSGFKSAKMSIFVYGWATGVVTLTSNKEVVGQFRTWVEANRKEETEAGPMIWKLNVTRNLLAKNANPRPGVFRKLDGGEGEE